MLNSNRLQWCHLCQSNFKFKYVFRRSILRTKNSCYEIITFGPKFVGENVLKYTFDIMMSSWCHGQDANQVQTLVTPTFWRSLLTMIPLWNFLIHFSHLYRHTGDFEDTIINSLQFFGVRMSIDLQVKQIILVESIFLTL